MDNTRSGLSSNNTTLLPSLRLCLLKKTQENINKLQEATCDGMWMVACANRSILPLLPCFFLLVTVSSLPGQDIPRWF